MQSSFSIFFTVFVRVLLFLHRSAKKARAHTETPSTHTPSSSHHHRSARPTARKIKAFWAPMVMHIWKVRADAVFILNFSKYTPVVLHSLPLPTFRPTYNARKVPRGMRSAPHPKRFNTLRIKTGKYTVPGNAD